MARSSHPSPFPSLIFSPLPYSSSFLLLLLPSPPFSCPVLTERFANFINTTVIALEREDEDED
jgi:hypothetical protein